MEVAQAKRSELISVLADVDEQIGDLFLNEETPTSAQLGEAVRRATVDRKFTPVLLGSAIKDKGIQPLLDAVCSYLPSPLDRRNYALDTKNNEEPVLLTNNYTDPFVGLAFKLEEGRYGQLTYVKVYQGTLKKGAMAVHVRTGKKIKISRLVRMHANEMEVIF